MDEPIQLRPMPSPPRLHWAIVAVLTLVTFGLFGQIWVLVLALWVRRVRGSSKALWFLSAYVALFPLLVVVTSVLAVVSLSELVTDRLAIVGVFQGLAYGLYFAAILTLMGELGSAPIGLRLRGIPTAFFGPVYFQFRLQKFPRRRAVEL